MMAEERGKYLTTILLDGADMAKKLAVKIDAKNLYETYVSFRLASDSLRFTLLKDNDKEAKKVLDMIDKKIMQFKKRKDKELKVKK